jgi:hypothetical protein
VSPSRKEQEKAGVGQVSRLTTYVVDYDLPADFRRKRFYRAISRYLSLNQLEETGWSTWSVVWTDNKAFAWEVYRQARAVGGTAHVYEARRLDDEP